MSVWTKIRNSVEDSVLQADQRRRWAEEGPFLSRVGTPTDKIVDSVISSLQGSDKSKKATNTTPTSTPKTAKIVSPYAIAGMFRKAVPGTQQIGVDTAGQPLYAHSALLKSADNTAGGALVGMHKQIFNDLGAFIAGDTEKFDSISREVTSPELLSSLDTLVQSKNFDKFQSATLSALQKQRTPETDALTKELFQYWGQISPAQKSLALGTLGLHNIQSANGDDLGTRILPATEGTGYAPLNTATAYNLFNGGYNAFSLIDNWETLNDIHALAGGHSDPQDVADMAAGQGLLGSGQDGQAVSGVSAKSLAGTGWFASPHQGVGAITGKIGAVVPKNYTLLSRTGVKQIAVPTASLPTVASGSTSGSLINTAAGHGGVSDNAQKLYSSWPEAHSRRANQGAVGGSAMVSGLYAMSRTNPLLFSATVASSFVDPKNQKLDYGNDVHYLTHLGVSSLDRLTTGEKASEAQTDIKSILNEVGSEKLDKKTFDALTTRLRAEYASKGVKSKADAYALTNQAFAERRINAVDLVGMQKTFNMLYDRTGMDTAHKLLTGREKGIELAKTKGSASGLPKLKASQTMTSRAPLGKEEIKARNRQRYGMAAPAAAPVEAVQPTGV